MKRNRRVKILATLGPASSTHDVIAKIFDEGADVFRINMSHTTHDQAREYHNIIRSIEAEKGRPIGILVDLQGPKIRVGEFADGKTTLQEGATFTLDQDKTAGTDKRIYLPHPEIFQAIEPGHILLLDDGRIRLRAVACDARSIECEVEIAGILSNRKGVSLPDTLIPVSAMTAKDRKDLDFTLSLGIDWVALSFVQRPEDVAEARTQAHGNAAIMAKIEKPSAMRYLDEILDIADGLMIARGDLGVELPIEKVPGLQKQITRAARAAGKPVVVATQMLETMITAPVPTRAEVSDVATAVFEGADAIMLSAESAVGDYPDRAIAMMDKIAREVEQDPYYSNIIYAQLAEPEATSADAISAAARSVAETLNLAAIICYTSSGATGLRAARERPLKPIIALTPKAETGRRLAIVWGLHCVLSADAQDLDDMVDKACRIAFQENFAKPGQRVIISAGVPLGTPGATNMLRVAYVGADSDFDV